MKLRILALAGAALSAVSVHAAEKVTVVHAGQLLDKPGSPPKGPSTIIIRDGRIAQIISGIVDVRLMRPKLT
jgi:hypothetical protein